MTTTFDHDEFVNACLAAIGEDDPIGAVREVVERAVSDPASIARTYEVPLDPDNEGILHRSSDLFITQVVFPRGFCTGLHDHTIPAIIGVWGGYEDNLVYRTDGARVLDGGQRHRVEPGQVLTLGAKDAHDVHAPDGGWSGALHVYLGDLISLERGAWETVDGERGIYDGAEQERRWTEVGKATGLFRTE